MSVPAVLALLVALQIKHFIADFCVQSGTMVRDKGVYGHPAGIAHAATHGGLSLPILLVAGADAGLALVVALAEVAVHYHVDWAKARFVDTRGLDPGRRPYWIAVGIDQTLHQFTLVAMTSVVADATADAVHAAA